MTDLYCKVTDCHQYLHYDSCHPNHIKRLSLHSKRIWKKCPCTGGHKLQKHLEKLKNWFCERGYPGGLIDEKLQKFQAKSREELLRPKGIFKKSVGIPFLVGYLSSTP